LVLLEVGAGVWRAGGDEVGEALVESWCAGVVPDEPLEFSEGSDSVGGGVGGDGVGVLGGGEGGGVALDDEAVVQLGDGGLAASCAWVEGEGSVGEFHRLAAGCLGVLNVVDDPNDPHRVRGVVKGAVSGNVDGADEVLTRSVFVVL
jgi:hypothetical protein